VTFGAISRRLHVVGFPGWTHLLVSVAFGLYTIGALVGRYGIDSVDGWWGGGSMDVMVTFAVTVLLVVGVPAAWIEAWGLGRYPQLRWLARTVAGLFVLVVGWWPLVPVGLRLFGDTRPLRLQEVTLGVACYLIVTWGQAIVAVLVSAWWISRKRWREVMSDQSRVDT
jgi:hypothetical protein